MSLPRSRSSPYQSRRRLNAQDVAGMLTEDVDDRARARERSGTYLPRESLYLGPRRNMHESDEENIDPDFGFTSTPRRSSFQNREETTAPSIISMLQQQQSLLHRLVENQKKIEEKQSEFEEKLKEVSESMSARSQPSSSPDTDKANRKIRIKRDLTRKVSALYESLEHGFRESEGSTSEFNAAIKKKIIQEICALPDSKHTEEEVKAAVQRRYESVRRQWKMEESFGDDFIEKSRQMSIARKYRARRKRKFESRALVVRPDEVVYWSQLSIDDMSEESDNPDDHNNLIIHKFPWCSEEFNEFKATLDDRYVEKNKKDSVLVARKTRTEGAPSTTKPRSHAPGWIIHKDWSQDSTQE